MNSDRVLMMLAALAEQSGERVSEFRIEFLATELLKTAEPAAICDALKRLLGSSRRFPTLDEVKANMGLTEVTDQARAAEAAARIEGAIVKYGSSKLGGNFDRQKQFMGELAWAVCERLGGYQHLCDTLTNDDMSTAKAQWRGLASALCESAKRGTLDTGPALPSGPVRAEIAALAEKCDVRPAKYRLPDPDTEEPPF